MLTCLGPLGFRDPALPQHKNLSGQLPCMDLTVFLGATFGTDQVYALLLPNPAYDESGAF